MANWLNRGISVAATIFQLFAAIKALKSFKQDNSAPQALLLINFSFSIIYLVSFIARDFYYEYALHYITSINDDIAAKVLWVDNICLLSGFDICLLGCCYAISLWKKLSLAMETSGRFLIDLIFKVFNRKFSVGSFVSMNLALIGLMIYDIHIIGVLVGTKFVVLSLCELVLVIAYYYIVVFAIQNLRKRKIGQRSNASGLVKLVLLTIFSSIVNFTMIIQLLVENPFKLYIFDVKPKLIAYSQDVQKLTYMTFPFSMLIMSIIYRIKWRNPFSQSTKDSSSKGARESFFRRPSKSPKVKAIAAASYDDK
ncbi:hypothetical protein ROZALSC1DRAFT_22912 [Rozella allomycis CSF55]|uniref:Uncharacterized protein n=1 Tax=Rozella allomycis (strain CSF55) TaxID=988480 RepID=A0A4P9YGV5_ROZAC|nr:hypothetical protein ROZALSC1DRAFT_22912 [Rozella allomycis CSF55]